MQPISPPSAMSAYMPIPPPGMWCGARLNVPGQKIPTESPHSAQPISPGRGAALSEAYHKLETASPL